MTNEEQFNKVYEKIDNVIRNQHNIELALTKKVLRNTLVINAALWIIGVLFVAGLGFVFTLL